MPAGTSVRLWKDALVRDLDEVTEVTRSGDLPVQHLVEVIYRRAGNRHRPSDVEWGYCQLTRVPCVNEFVDLGEDGTWRVLQVLHGPERQATIWIKRADVTKEPWLPGQ
jgi:hypothetical protein